MEKWIKTAEIVGKNPTVQEHYRHRSLNWANQLDKMTEYPKNQENRE